MEKMFDRRMSLRCRPLRMFGKADDDRQLPLSRLPEIERRALRDGDGCARFGAKDQR